MSIDDLNSHEEPPARIDPAAASWVFLGMLGLAAAGCLTYYMLSSPSAPPPPEVAGDPLLLEGRSIYLARCATCHGQEGRGDGPIAGSLLVSPARKPALNSGGMFSEPTTHLLVGPCPFNGVGVPMVVFRPRSQDMRLEFLLALPGRTFQVIVLERMNEYFCLV